MHAEPNNWRSVRLQRVLTAEPVVYYDDDNDTLLTDDHIKDWQEFQMVKN